MAEQVLTIQSATHEHTTGAALIAVGESTVIFEHGDVLWRDGDVEFFPLDPGILVVQSPSHALTTGTPNLVVVGVAAKSLDVQSPTHKVRGASDSGVVRATFRPLVETDCGWYYEDSDPSEGYENGGATGRLVGFYNPPNWDAWGICVRFPEVELGQGAAATAELSLYSNDAEASVPDFKIYGLLEADGNCPVDLAGWTADIAGNLTTASVDWAPGAGAGWKDIDVSVIVQEIIAQVGWAYDNPIVLFVTNDQEAATGYRSFNNHNFGASANAPKLQIISNELTLQRDAGLTVQDALHKQLIFLAELTTGGGGHDNTQHIIYNATNYLRCRHQHGRLDGIYTSPIFDIGSADRYLVYIVGQDPGEEDIVVVGAGTTWDDQVPVANTWNDINVSTSSWTNIFALDKGPSVTMRVYYGPTSPPTNYVDRMEILSAIVTNARYLQAEITITDPGLEVFAYVEEFHLRFCQPA